MTGARGGHDLNYRTLQTMGVHLWPLTGVEGQSARFADDLADSVAFGDARYADIRAALSNQLAAKGMPVPELPDPPPFCADPPRELDLDGFGAVICTTGFRPDYTRWVRFPASSMPWASRSPTTTPARWSPASIFCGVHFLRKRKSSTLFGVGEDAAIVARSIARNRSEPAAADFTSASRQGRC